MAKLKYVIAIIDDDPLVNESLSNVLAERYEQVISYTDSDKALEEVEAVQPDLILLDIFMGDRNGFDVLQVLRDRGLRMPVIMITAFSDVKMAVRAVKLGAEDFIVKPPDMEQLEVSVERALKNHDLRRQVDILQERLVDEQSVHILGNSEQLQSILQFAEMIARGDDTTVLILGESGTGKELIARYLHQKSPRANGPFVSVNCGAIPRELAENELFGYEKGAFTGATEKVKHGRFEMAHRGTILLDEVGELSLEMQVKLLRVLQEKKFYRLGGSREVSINVRVIAATNRDLEKLIEEGKFREDLYYRLNVATITTPPLRERPDDILLLATAFVREFSRKFGKKIAGFTPEAVELLQSYEWKGNVRELRNVIERVTLLEATDIISRDSLKFLRGSTTTHTPAVSTKELLPGQHQLVISRQGTPMSDVVRDLITQTLKITGGNQLQAARILGISRAKLRYRIEQLQIPINSKISS